VKADNGRINELCDIIEAAMAPKATKAAKEDADAALAELRQITA